MTAVPPEKAPEAAPVAGQPDKPEAVSDKGGRKTLFERFDKRRNCRLYPAACEGDLFEVEIKKSIEQEIDPATGLTSEFCIGGCSKKNALQWSLEW